MRYILVTLNYITDMSWWFIIEYSEQTCEVRTLAKGSEHDDGNHITDFYTGVAGLDDCSIFSSMFNASFDQVMNMLNEYCDKRFNGGFSLIDYEVKEVPKKKVFELML